MRGGGGEANFDAMIIKILLYDYKKIFHVLINEKNITITNVHTLNSLIRDIKSLMR